MKNNNPSLEKKAVLTTKEAAILLKVGVQTIKNYIYQGRIKSFKTPGGHHRILRSELPSQLDIDIPTDDKVNPELHNSYLVIINALTKALAMRETRNPEYTDSAVRYCMKMAESLDMSNEEKNTLELAYLLRDIGKIGISEQILAKPGKLTEEEYDLVKEHPKIAERIVGDIKFLEGTRPLIRHYHENFNGKGYPDGLKGENIPLGARIVAIAGVFQALISDRPYRKAYSKEEALKIIRNNSGSQFDPTLVDLFISSL